MPRRLWNFFWTIRCPLGARVYIEQKKPSVSSAGYCSYGGKITLFQKTEDVEQMIEILNHEILHSVLKKIAGTEAWNNLDNIQKWNKVNKLIIFKKVEDDEDSSSIRSS